MNRDRVEIFARLAIPKPRTYNLHVHLRAGTYICVAFKSQSQAQSDQRTWELAGARTRLEVV